MRSCGGLEAGLQPKEATRAPGSCPVSNAKEKTVEYPALQPKTAFPAPGPVSTPNRLQQVASRLPTDPANPCPPVMLSTHQLIPSPPGTQSTLPDPQCHSSMSWGTSLPPGHPQASTPARSSLAVSMPLSSGLFISNTRLLASPLSTWTPPTKMLAYPHGPNHPSTALTNHQPTALTPGPPIPPCP